MPCLRPRDPNHRWQGVTAIYQTPAYNTKLVAAAELPQTHEDFLKLSKWAGRVAINDTESEWLMSLLAFYGEDKGRSLIQSMVATLKPVMVSGHLALGACRRRRRIRTGVKQLRAF